MQPNPAGDPRFYARSGPFPVAEVAISAGGTAPPSPLMITGVAALDAAGPTEVSFLHDRRYAPALATTRAGAVVIHPDHAATIPPGVIAIFAPATYEAWARVAGLFHPIPPATPGIHPLALIDPAATVDPTAEIAPFAWIEAGATIGPRTCIGPYASIGRGVVIGPDCRIGAHTSLSHSILGARVVLHPGVRTGQEGFSFAHTKQGFLTVPQLGRVLIEDDVEIGANTTIDRGSIQNTVIGAGTRIDNLVQIGHNVRIGRCCVIVGQAGIAGSAILEDFVQVSGQVAITGHVRIGKGAQLAGQSGVIGNVDPGAIMMGTPALPRGEFFRGVALLRRLVRQKEK